MDWEAPYRGRGFGRPWGTPRKTTSGSKGLKTLVNTLITDGRDVVCVSQQRLTLLLIIFIYCQNTVNIYIFTQYILSVILRNAIDVYN